MVHACCKWLCLILILILAQSAHGEILVRSLKELKTYLDDDNVEVKLAPGVYKVSAEDIKKRIYGKSISGEIIEDMYSVFPFEGNGSVYDFTGVTIKFDTKAFKEVGKVSFVEIHLLGNNNVIKNLTMIDDGSVNDAPKKTARAVVMDGRKNRIEGLNVTVKGSYPYGYGDIFGKGGQVVIRHRKHSGFMVKGTENHVKNCKITHRAYGHAIFIQGGIDTVIEGCEIEGELSNTNKVLAEEGTGSAADEVDFKTVWGFNLRKVPHYQFSLQEGGIRAYTSGKTIVDGEEFERRTSGVTIKDCKIIKIRSAVSIGFARGEKSVENTTALACESGFWVGSGTVVKDCRGDSSVGPLFSEDRESSKSKIQLTLLDDFVKRMGEAPSLYIAGSGHEIELHDGTTKSNKGIKILVGGTRLAHRWEEGTQLNAKEIKFKNHTSYPVFLGKNTKENRITSKGSVTDKGEDNKVKKGR